jgi:hypothetical protein
MRASDIAHGKAFQKQREGTRIDDGQDTPLWRDTSVTHGAAGGEPFANTLPGFGKEKE